MGNLKTKDIEIIAGKIRNKVKITLRKHSKEIDGVIAIIRKINSINPIL